MNTTCSCDKKHVDTQHHRQDCDLWRNDDWISGRYDWDPKGQALVLVGQDSLFPEDDATLGVTCICSPPKKMFCLSCGVERNKEEDQWVWIEWERLRKLRGKDWKPGKIKTTSTTATNWESKCRHKQFDLVFPNGVHVFPSSMNSGLQADFGIYLASGWHPLHLAYYIDWQDYGLPTIPWEQVVFAIKEGYALAATGARVEVGCIGGHGRTGTVLACMAVLAGVPGSEAVQYVRTNYCKNAVESAKQSWFVLWFESQIKGTECPDMPKDSWEKKEEKK